MNDLDMNELELDWMRDAASGLRFDLERELTEQPGQPDLADVFARARALDLDAVPQGLIATNDPTGQREVELFDEDLALFANALRTEVEHDVADRAMQPVVGPDAPHSAPPVAPAPRPAPRPARRSWGLAGVVALAAAVVAVVGFGTLQTAPQRLESETTPASMASKSLGELAEADAWTRAVPSPKPTTHKRVATPKAIAPAPLEVIVPDPPAPAVSPRRPVVQRPPLDALEADAIAAWKAGELQRAESLLRTIIRRAGRGTKAELAYGDLFALEKQRGGAAKQAKIWRQYLRRFPQGRYADDARAGLCMRTSGQAASVCWADYLAKHPRGAHANRANPAQRATQ